MQIVDFQIIKYEDINDLDNTIIVYDECATGDALQNLHGLRVDPEHLYGFVTFEGKCVDAVRGKKGFWYSANLFPLGIYIEDIYPIEIKLLKQYIEKHQDKTFIINPLGLFLNHGWIFFHCIRPRMPEDLAEYDNVILMWNNIPEFDELRWYSIIPCSFPKRGGKGYETTYQYLKNTYNRVDLNRLNNKHIPYELPSGVYVKES